MGRNKIESALKKTKLSVTISLMNYNNLIEFGIKNRSKLIDWLLKEHFGMLDINNPGDCETSVKLD